MSHPKTSATLAPAADYELEASAQTMRSMKRHTARVTNSQRNLIDQGCQDLGLEFASPSLPAFTPGVPPPGGEEGLAAAAAAAAFSFPQFQQRDAISQLPGFLKDVSTLELDRLSKSESLRKLDIEAQSVVTHAEDDGGVAVSRTRRILESVGLCVDKSGLELSVAKNRYFCGPGRFLGIKMRALEPHSGFYQGWMILLLFLLIYTATVMPFRIAFVEEETLQWFIVELMVDFLFLSDLVVNFLLAYRDKHSGKLVKDFGKIAVNYVTGWFIIDLIACIPFTLMVGYEASFETGENRNRATRVARLPRIARLLRFLSAARLLKLGKNGNLFRPLLQRYFRQRVVLSGLVSILGIVVAIHFLACLWYYLARVADYDYGTWVRRHLSTLIVNADGEAVPDECLGLDDLTTLEQIDTCLRPMEVRYIASVYWVITTVTTVGYGDITPYEVGEYVMAIIVMCLGVAMYANILSRLTSMVTASDGRREYMDRQLLSLYMFCQGSKYALTSYSAGTLRFSGYKANGGASKVSLVVPVRLSPKAYAQLSQQVVEHISEAAAQGPRGVSLSNVLSHFSLSVRTQIGYLIHEGRHLQLDFFSPKTCIVSQRDLLVAEIAPFLEPLTIRPDLHVHRAGHMLGGITALPRLHSSIKPANNTAAAAGKSGGSGFGFSVIPSPQLRAPDLARAQTALDEESLENDDLNVATAKNSERPLPIDESNDGPGLHSAYSASEVEADTAVLYGQGEQPEALFFLMSGLVGPLAPTDSGRPKEPTVAPFAATDQAESEVPMFWFKEKSYFGDVELLLQEPRKFTVKAFTVAHVFRLPEGALLRAFCKMPDLLRGMRKAAAKKLRHYSLLMSRSELARIQTDKGRMHRARRLLNANSGVLDPVEAFRKPTASVDSDGRSSGSDVDLGANPDSVPPTPTGKAPSDKTIPLTTPAIGKPPLSGRRRVSVPRDFRGRTSLGGWKPKSYLPGQPPYVPVRRRSEGGAASSGAAAAAAAAVADWQLRLSVEKLQDQLAGQTAALEDIELKLRTLLLVAKSDP